jgi:hypothetical protein
VKGGRPINEHSEPSCSRDAGPAVGISKTTSPMRAEHHTFLPIVETTPTDVRPLENTTLVHAVLEMVKLINSQMGQQFNATPPPFDVGASSIKDMKEFWKLDPPHFEGATDPSLAENWIENIEVIFGLMMFLEDREVDFATLAFRGNGKDSWAIEKIGINDKIINLYAFL